MGFLRKIYYGLRRVVDKDRCTATPKVLYDDVIKNFRIMEEAIKNIEEMVSSTECGTE